MLCSNRVLVVGLLSCVAATQRRSWCRDLWVRRAADYAAVDVFFAIGSPDVTRPVRIDDLLLVPCDDAYACLPQKTRWMLQYSASEHPAAHFFKADDDTYVHVDRLLGMVPTQDAYTGYPIGSYAARYAHGGSGYLLTPGARDIAALGLESYVTGDEDRSVGTVLRAAGIRLHEDRRLIPDFNPAYVPRARNACVTVHRIRTQAVYNQLRDLVLWDELGNGDLKGEQMEPTNKNAKPGLLVEDTSVVGGTDATTGAPVIRPKTQEGKADESTRPTDQRETPAGEVKK